MAPYVLSSLPIPKLLHLFGVFYSIFYIHYRSLFFNQYLISLVLFTLKLLGYSVLDNKNNAHLQNKNSAITHLMWVFNTMFLTLKITIANYHLILIYLGYTNCLIWHVQKLFCLENSDYQVLGNPRNAPPRTGRPCPPLCSWVRQQVQSCDLTINTQLT